MSKVDKQVRQCRMLIKFWERISFTQIDALILVGQASTLKEAKDIANCALLDANAQLKELLLDG